MHEGRILENSADLRGTSRAQHILKVVEVRGKSPCPLFHLLLEQY